MQLDQYLMADISKYLSLQHKVKFYYLLKMPIDPNTLYCEFEKLNYLLGRSVLCKYCDNYVDKNDALINQCCICATNYCDHDKKYGCQNKMHTDCTSYCSECAANVDACELCKKYYCNNKLCMACYKVFCKECYDYHNDP